MIVSGPFQEKLKNFLIYILIFFYLIKKKFFLMKLSLEEKNGQYYIMPFHIISVLAILVGVMFFFFCKI